MKKIISIALLVGFSSFALAADVTQRIQPTATEWLGQSGSDNTTPQVQPYTDGVKSEQSAIRNVNNSTALRHNRLGYSGQYRFGHTKRKLYSDLNRGRLGHHKKRIFNLSKKRSSKGGRIGSSLTFRFTNRDFGHRSGHRDFGFSKFNRYGVSKHYRY